MVKFVVASTATWETRCCVRFSGCACAHVCAGKVGFKVAFCLYFVENNFIFVTVCFYFVSVLFSLRILRFFICHFWPFLCVVCRLCDCVRVCPPGWFPAYFFVALLCQRFGNCDCVFVLCFLCCFSCLSCVFLFAVFA